MYIHIYIRVYIHTYICTYFSPRESGVSLSLWEWVDSLTSWEFVRICCIIDEIDPRKHKSIKPKLTRILVCGALCWSFFAMLKKKRCVCFSWALGWVVEGFSLAIAAVRYLTHHCCWCARWVAHQQLPACRPSPFVSIFTPSYPSGVCGSFGAMFVAWVL